MLNALLMIPILTALAVFAAGRGAPRLARGTALAGGVGLVLHLVYLATIGGALPAERFVLAPSLGLVLRFSFWGPSLGLALMIALGLTAIVLAAPAERLRATAFLLFPLMSTSLAALFAEDFLTWFVFQEFGVVVIAVALAGWGSSLGIDAAKRFLASSLFGSAALLAGVGFLHFRNLPAEEAGWELLLAGKEPWLLFVAFAIGFGLRIGVFPLHGWSLRVKDELPPAMGAILGLTLVPLAGFGLARHGLGPLEGIAPRLEDFMVSAGALSALLAAFLLARETRHGRALALFALIPGSTAFAALWVGPDGRDAGLALLLAQGLALTVLHLLLQVQGSSRGGAGAGRDDPTGGSGALTRLAWLAAVAFPGGLAFVAEFRVCFALLERHPIAALVIGSSLVFASGSLGRLTIRTSKPAVDGRGTRGESPDGAAWVWGIIALLVLASVAGGLVPDRLSASSASPQKAIEISGGSDS